MSVAVWTGRISHDEYDDLTEVNLIVRGRNRRHLVVDISLEPDEEDVSRAIRRSEILQSAIAEPVTPVVAAPPDPQPEFVSDAEARNVTVLNILA